MKKRCKICRAAYEAPPSSKRVTCGLAACRDKARVQASKRKRLSLESRAKIGDGVRKGGENKVPMATRWAADCEAKMRAHTARTGESRVAALERLVRTHL